MVHFVGLDVSVKATSVCVVDDAGKVILEQKVSTDPADIIAILTSLGVSFGRIGIEAGPLSQWLPAFPHPQFAPHSTRPRARRGRTRRPRALRRGMPRAPMLW
jgi:hypothetical protein